MSGLHSAPTVKSPSLRKPLLSAPALAGILLLTLLRASQGTEPQEAIPEQKRAGPIFAVVGGLLIDGTGAEPIPDTAIIIEGGRVMAAGPRRETRIPPGAVAIDATGLTVLPGLIDMHTHLAEGADLGAYLRYGVTSVRHMGATTIEEIRRTKAAVESGRIPGPRIFHCGSYVVSQPPLKPEALPKGELEHFSVMRSPADAGPIVARLKEAGADLVKVKAHMTPESLRALCAAAAVAGLPVSFDSDGGSSYGIMEALDSGARGVEHLSGIDFESASATEAALRRMLEVRAFADPTFAVLGRIYGNSRLSARREFIRKYARRGGIVVAGTDAPTHGTPPGASLHEELKYLTEAGLTPLEAIVAATGAAGRALGYQGIVGTIEAGSFADIVIVRGAPHEDIGATLAIERVFKGGVQVHPPPSE